MKIAEKTKPGNKGSFQKQLAENASQRVYLLVGISCILFIIGLIALTCISNELNARHHLETLVSSFCELDTAERVFLEDKETLKMVRKILSEEENGEETEKFSTAFRRYFSSQSVITNYIITSGDKKVIASSYGDMNFSTYLINYIYASCYRASEEGDGVYRTVYYETGEYADPLYILPVKNNGAVEGYLTLLLSGSSWNYMLSEKNYDGVVADLRNNVMYTSKYGLVTSMNKYRGKDEGSQTAFGCRVTHVAGSRYWVVARKLEERAAIVYSLVYYPQNGDILVGLLIMVFMGVLWREIANGMAKDMAARNAASIDGLVRELRIIRKEDPGHRVQVDSGDEFSEVGDQINRMMDSISELNSRNTELVRLNARFEMNELTAQMNPHFLYNTLEIIRNLVYFDAEKGSELIGQLTEILRYSVNKSKREVPFSEDMQFIDRYLRIQYVRFGDRLKCEIDAAPESGAVIVPKLLLQPIIENSIKYGFRHQMNLHIRIRSFVEKDVLTVRVEDDGGGIEPEKLAVLQRQLLQHDNSAESIGLRNLSRRLYLRYGPGSGLSIRSTDGPGTEVTVTINTKAPPTARPSDRDHTYRQEGKAENSNV